MSQNWSKRVTFMSHEDRDLEWCEWVSVDIKNGKGIIWVRTGVFFQSILRRLSDPQTFVKNHCARSYDFKISVRANFHREILGFFTFWSTMVLRCKTQSWLKVSKSRKKMLPDGDFAPNVKDLTSTINVLKNSQFHESSE